MNNKKIEQEFKESDIVRKSQIDYNESICMVEKFPEAMHIGNDETCNGVLPTNSNLNLNSNQLYVVAPGENKSPVNLLHCKDWDVKAFPMLHPDGKNNLSDDRRKKKLNDSDYFKQRLFNRDTRFRDNTH